MVDRKSYNPQLSVHSINILLTSYLYLILYIQFLEHVKVNNTQSLVLKNMQSKRKEDSDNQSLSSRDVLITVMAMRRDKVFLSESENLIKFSWQNREVERKKKRNLQNCFLQEYLQQEQSHGQITKILSILVFLENGTRMEYEES